MAEIKKEVNLTKDGKTMKLSDAMQIRAYKNAGWKDTSVPQTPSMQEK